MNDSAKSGGRVTIQGPVTGSEVRLRFRRALDLRRQIPEAELLQLALIAAANQVPPTLPALPASCGRSLPPANLASLLAFAYATGRFSSEDIAAECLETSVMKYLAVGRPVEWTELRRFRRRHRCLVVACLAELLCLVRDRNPAIDRGTDDAAVLRDPVRTAHQLVEKAILADLATVDV
jgi:hypothetical protein